MRRIFTQPRGLLPMPQHTARDRRALQHACLAALLLILATRLLTQWFTLGLNSTPSLPHTLYLIHKGASVTRGQYVAFRWHGGGPYAAGTLFIKILVGEPGDTVSAHEAQFSINGTPLGNAKPTSRTGAPLERGPVGELPPRRYYVHAPHPDSLDSRYRFTGWIDHTQIIGRAYALF